MERYTVAEPLVLVGLPPRAAAEEDADAVLDWVSDVGRDAAAARRSGVHAKGVDQDQLGSRVAPLSPVVEAVDRDERPLLLRERPTIGRTEVGATPVAKLDAVLREHVQGQVLLALAGVQAAGDRPVDILTRRRSLGVRLAHLVRQQDDLEPDLAQHYGEISDVVADEIKIR